MRFCLEPSNTAPNLALSALLVLVAKAVLRTLAVFEWSCTSKPICGVVIPLSAKVLGGALGRSYGPWVL